MNTKSRRAQLIERMKNSKVFRDRFVSSHLSHTLALQIRTLREARELTQKDLGDKIGTPQTGIARLEKIGYEKYNLSTLKRLASAFDVGLVLDEVPEESAAADVRPGGRLVEEEDPGVM